MKILEASVILVVAVGFAFRVFGVEKGEVLVYIGMMILCLLYLFGHTFLYKKQERKLVFTILSGIALAITVALLMNKVQLIPGAADDDSIRSMLFLLVLVIAYAVYRWYKKDAPRDFYKQVLVRTSALALIALCVLLIPMQLFAYLYYNHDQKRLELEIKKLQHPDDPLYFDMIDQYEKDQRERTE